MSKIVQFGSPVVETGKNKGNPATLSFATGISPENSNGLPVEKGKVFLSVQKDIPQVVEFDSADEVRAIAGENFDAFVLEAANDLMRSLVRNALTADARKLTLPPSDLSAWVNSVCERITPDVAFTPADKQTRAKGPRGVKAEISNLAARASSMSQEELLAQIQALAAKIG